MKDIVKEFQEMSSVLERINSMGELLLENGFDEEIHEGRLDRENHFFTKSGEGLVFCSIVGGSKDPMMVVLDKDVYEDKIRVTDAGKKGVLCPKQREDGKYKVVSHSRPYNNTALPHIVMGYDAGIQVDHITHNLGINTRDSLRVCTAQQNAFNKRFYSKVAENKHSFSMPNKVAGEADLKTLLAEDYTLKGNRLYSPEFTTISNMYEALNQLERKLLGEYRYNPRVDFSETWYVYVLCRVLGAISEEDMYDYNRNYLVSKDSELADYYQI